MHYKGSVAGFSIPAAKKKLYIKDEAWELVMQKEMINIFLNEVRAINLPLGSLCIRMWFKQVHSSKLQTQLDKLAKQDANTERQAIQSDLRQAGTKKAAGRRGTPPSKRQEPLLRDDLQELLSFAPDRLFRLRSPRTSRRFLEEWNNW